MHFSIPSRSADQTTLPGSPSFKAKSRASSHHAVYPLYIFTQLRSVIRDALTSAQNVTAPEKKRQSARRTLSMWAIAVFAAVTVFLTIMYVLFANIATSDSAGPRVVLVLGLDNGKYKEDYLAKIIENRREYADAHKYGLYVRNMSDFKGSVHDAAKLGWYKLPLMRSAMQDNPGSTYFWYLDQNAIIMNPNLNIESHITDVKRLNSLVLRDVPVVPPDSTIRTYRHVPADRMKFIISQDHEGFQTGSFILKNGEYAWYVLDAWFDKLYQEYKFQKAEKSSLEHLAQWHPTVLSKMAIIPQRIFNAYPNGVGDSLYQDGDFVASLAGCDTPERSCVREFERLWDNRGRVVN
ncbi:galactosyl transferase GMA12/MNN10 family-domain-containing protein [Lipomyces kononenkoae]|uniref:Galactosyl transferase GMA12/MNN10 family-domain-containing protein n=1 Tax=Lipomyces kononenkoae TaxID=34357 RepID=A0ACC3T8R0_LIPKO